MTREQFEAECRLLMSEKGPKGTVLSFNVQDRLARHWGVAAEFPDGRKHGVKFPPNRGFPDTLPAKCIGMLLDWY